jgi:hypothetical protein
MHGGCRGYAQRLHKLCTNAAEAMHVFLPIIIPHQPSCFVLFCFVGWIVAIPCLS